MLTSWFRLLCLSVFLVASSTAHAQDLTQRSSVWAATFFDVDLDANKDSGPRAWLDMHFRQLPGVQDRPDAFLGIFRPAVGWEFVPGVALWGGYAWIPGVPSGGTLRNEHNAWMQLTLAHTFGSVKLALRPRGEFRTVLGQPDLGGRIRLFGRVNVALPGPVGLAIWDELFFGVNETAWQAKGLHENRTFLGVGITASEEVRIEMGYMARYNGANSSLDQPLLTHVAVVALSFKLAPARRSGVP